MFGNNFYPPTKQNIAADKRLQRIYCITLEEYNRRLHLQGGVCAICKRPPKNVRLSVDHDHRFDRVKIIVAKGPVVFMWTARATDPHGEPYRFEAPTRALAKAGVKKHLRKASLRGLLCMSCNKGLQYYRDIPERFDAAALYLRKFNNEIPSNVAFTGPLHSFPTARPTQQIPGPPQTSL